MMPVVMQRKSSRMRNLIIVTLVFFLSMGIATQVFAWRFSYQAVLGAHMQHVYLPWSILLWADTWWTQFPTRFIEAGSAVFSLPVFCLSFFFFREPSNVTRHKAINTCTVQRGGHEKTISCVPDCWAKKACTSEGGKIPKRGSNITYATMEASTSSVLHRRVPAKASALSYRPSCRGDNHAS